MFLNSGFSTDGEMDRVLFVGPIAPATYLRIPEYKLTNKQLVFSSFCAKAELSKESNLNIHCCYRLNYFLTCNMLFIV